MRLLKIKAVLEDGTIKVYPTLGLHFSTIIAAMIKLAQDQGENVMTRMNAVDVVVTPTSFLQSSCAKYLKDSGHG